MVDRKDQRQFGDDEDVLFRDPDGFRELRVPDEVPQIAVHGDEVPRARQVDHDPQLFRVSVTGDVNARDLVVQDVRATPEKVIDNARHGALVAGDRPRGEDHRVARLELHGAMLVERDPGS